MADIDPGLIPYLIVRGAEDAITFYKNAFGATEKYRLVDPGDGRIGHAELRFGTSRIFLADEYPDFGAVSPDTIGGTPVTLHLSSCSVDADVQRAVEAGATLLREPADQSFGERSALVLDPFGHQWTLSQQIEDVSPEEMQRRWESSTSA